MGGVHKTSGMLHFEAIWGFVYFWVLFAVQLNNVVH